MKHKKVFIISIVSLLVVGIGIGSFYGYKGYLNNEIKKSNEQALKDLEYSKEIIKSKLKESNLNLSNIKNEDKNSPMVRNYTFKLWFYEFKTCNCIDYVFEVDKISVYAEDKRDLNEWETPSWDYILKSSFKELEELNGYFLIDVHAYDIGAVKRIRYYTSDFKGKAMWNIEDDSISLFESTFNEPSNNIYPHSEPIYDLD